MKIKAILRKNEEKRKANRRYKTLIKNHLKDFRLKLVKGNEQDINELKKVMIKAQEILDKAAVKGVIHKNNAARRKRKMFLTLKKLEAVFADQSGQ